MGSGSFSHFPGVYYVRNRIALIIFSIAIIVWSLLELLQILSSASPIVLSLFWILVWSYILLMAIRRRLVLSSEGLEYDDEFYVLRVNWSEVKTIESRKRLANLGWKTEGLVIRTDLPEGKEYFVDLIQFDRRWRKGPLGEVLQMKAPHLFKSDTSND